MAINCSGLENRQGSFADYISRLENATANGFAQARQCKTQVCTGLWGGGNPDISGIGMTIRYISSIILGTHLVIFFLLSQRIKHWNEIPGIQIITLL